MTAIRRADRVGKELQAELARLVQREVKDPRVQKTTITRVEVSDDLREAKVYFVPLGGIGETERITELEVGLKAAGPFLQRKIGRNLRLRFTPRLKFLYDVGVANLVDMHDLMHGLDLGAQGEDETETPAEPLPAATVEAAAADPSDEGGD